MGIDFSGDTGLFSKIENMYRSDIEDKSGGGLVKSINVFSSWIMSQSKTFWMGKRSYSGVQNSLQILL